MTDTAIRPEQSPQRLSDLVGALSGVILGKEDVIEHVLVALLARGHLLIEDIPGVGKTTLARALSRAIKCSFRRVQFTSDLLPSDILGVKVYEPKSSDFRFIPGPIFNSIVLADEINRTTPRTQSALLEAMNESQVTIEGETYLLPRPFMVIATDNPLEHHGTYPLPDSQLDRFLMSVSMGYPAREVEKRIVMRAHAAPIPEDFTPVMDGDEVVRWQERADEARLEPVLADYILDLVEATRSHPGLRLGASPRGALALRQSAKARAVISGRDYCLPDDVKRQAVTVLAHRVLVSGPGPSDERRRAAREIIEEIVETVPVPV